MRRWYSILRWFGLMRPAPKPYVRPDGPVENFTQIVRAMKISMPQKIAWLEDPMMPRLGAFTKLMLRTELWGNWKWEE